MSVEMMSLVFDCNMPELKTDKGQVVPDTTAKSILLALANFANSEGEGAYPGVRTLCRKTNYSTATVSNALNALRHNGFTKLVGRSKRDTCQYTILVAKILEFQWLKQEDSSGYNTSVSVAKTNPSSIHPKSIKKDSAGAPGEPKANQIPEVVLFRAVTGRYPNRLTFGKVSDFVVKISARLGRAACVDDLKPFAEAWAGKGYNPNAITWLEWAVSGEIPSYAAKKPVYQPKQSLSEFQAQLLSWANTRQEVSSGVNP